jgi:hypothetical protein
VLVVFPPPKLNIQNRINAEARGRKDFRGKSISIQVVATGVSRGTAEWHVPLQTELGGSHLASAINMWGPRSWSEEQRRGGDVGICRALYAAQVLNTGRDARLTRRRDACGTALPTVDWHRRETRIQKRKHPTSNAQHRTSNGVGTPTAPGEGTRPTGAEGFEFRVGVGWGLG